MSQIFRVTPRALFAAAATLLLLGACWLATAGPASAGKGEQKAKQIGATKKTPPADCPTSPSLGQCQAIGKTTVIQTVADGRNQPLRVTHDGKIVAYSIDFGAPTKHDRKVLGSDDFFGSSRYGASSTVRLAVLKRKGDRKFKLKRQSPTVVIGKSAFGNRFYLTLDRPLRITKGLYVGLTVPTWLTAVQGRVDNGDKVPGGFSKRGNQYISSRSSKKCVGTQNALSAHPHQKIGSTRAYGCKFTQARVLYKAYYVPNKK